jgi:hypothetical protein
VIFGSKGVIFLKRIPWNIGPRTGGPGPRVSAHESKDRSLNTNRRVPDVQLRLKREGVHSLGHSMNRRSNLGCRFYDRQP